MQGGEAQLEALRRVLGDEVSVARLLDAGLGQGLARLLASGAESRGDKGACVCGEGCLGEGRGLLLVVRVVLLYVQFVQLLLILSR